MTPNLLDELEKIVALRDSAEYENVYGSAESFAEADKAYKAGATSFIATHAPALADMAKRMEAAERDAARYRWLRDKAWSAPAKGTSPAVLMVGPDGEQVTNGVAAILDSDKLDAAIDATQEGEG